VSKSLGLGFEIVEFGVIKPCGCAWRLHKTAALLGKQTSMKTCELMTLRNVPSVC
jgi:hypothetical protein